jgi:hypothetical protein
MSKKLIVRIANGLGNQLFLYASAYALAKQLDRELLIDEESGFLNEERKIKYELDNFNITSKLSSNKYKFNNEMKNIKRFFLKKIDKFSERKNFLIEERNSKKETEFSNKYLKQRYKDIAFLEGYFQSEKYFINYKNNIMQEFTFKTEIKKNNLELQKMILNTNSILVHIRQHAFTETQKKQINEKNLLKSDQHTRENIVHNLKAIKYFKTKIDNAKFFIFSNDFKNLKNIFIGDEYYFVDQNIKLEPIYDFYLMTLCKHFIVSPSTFSWWAAWLSKNENKICISPPENMGMSSNRDVIPGNWINI